MKNITSILTEAGIEIDETKMAEINAEVAKNYKTIAEVDKMKAKLDTALTEKADLEEKINGLQGDSAELEELRKKVTEFNEKEAARQEDERKAAELTARRNRFATLNGDKQYLNEGTENWIFSKFEAAIADQANAGKSDAEIYAEITKDQNIFVNPQGKFITPPAGGKGGSEKPQIRQFF